jgi:hypothetical protein
MGYVMCCRLTIFLACILTTIAVSHAADSVNPKGWNGIYPGMSLGEAAELIKHYRWPETVEFDKRDPADLDPKKPRFLLAGVAIEEKPYIYSMGEENALEGVSPYARPSAKVDTVRVSFKHASNAKIKAYIEKALSLTCYEDHAGDAAWEGCVHEQGLLKVTLMLYSTSSPASYLSTVEWTVYRPYTP